MRHRTDTDRLQRLLARDQDTIERLTQERDDLRREVRSLSGLPEDVSLVDIATLVASVAELTQGWGDG